MLAYAAPPVEEIDRTQLPLKYGTFTNRLFFFFPLSSKSWVRHPLKFTVLLILSFGIILLLYAEYLQCDMLQSHVYDSFRDMMHQIITARAPLSRESLWMRFIGLDCHRMLRSHQLLEPHGITVKLSSSARSSITLMQGTNKEQSQTAREPYYTAHTVCLPSSLTSSTTIQHNRSQVNDLV